MLKLLLFSWSLFIKSSHAENQRLHELYKLPIYKLLLLEFKSFNMWWEMKLVIVEIVITSCLNNRTFLLMNDFWFCTIFIKHPSRTREFLFCVHRIWVIHGCIRLFCCCNILYHKRGVLKQYKLTLFRL